MDLCETFQKQFASGLVPRHEKLQDEKKFERFTSSRMGAFRMAGLSSAEPSLPRSQARWKPGRAVAQPALCFPCDCIITPGCIRRVPWGGQRRPGVSSCPRARQAGSVSGVRAAWRRETPDLSGDCQGGVCGCQGNQSKGPPAAERTPGVGARGPVWRGPGRTLRSVRPCEQALRSPVRSRPVRSVVLSWEAGVWTRV